jgi:predicted nucleic acid-binding protein
VKILLDSNVLLRWSDSKAAEHASCMEAVSRLAESANVVCVCAQVIIESYVVATRPVEVNGLGFSSHEARQTLTDIESSFACLSEPPDIAVYWRRLIEQQEIMGRQAHDARIAALMLAHDVRHILTLNPSDFIRYEGITPVAPLEILRDLASET